MSSLAGEVFDQFVAPHYQTEGVAEFHRYASVEALSQRHESGHITLVAEHSGELVGMLHLRKPCHVSMLFVQPSRQRGGIGRGLLAAAGALPEGLNLEAITVEPPREMSHGDAATNAAMVLAKPTGQNPPKPAWMLGRR